MSTGYDKRDPLASCRRLVKTLLEALIEAEFCLFLSRERAAERGVQRNGYAQKTVRGCFGEFPIRVPRDRGGRFLPLVLPKGKILISELEDLLVPVFGSYRSRRRFDGRLRAFLRVVATLYGESFSHGERRELLFALLRGCREHQAWISGLRYEPAELGVIYKEYGWLGPYYGQVASENLTNSRSRGCFSDTLTDMINIVACEGFLEGASEPGDSRPDRILVGPGESFAAKKRKRRKQDRIPLLFAHSVFLAAISPPGSSPRSSLIYTGEVCPHVRFPGIFALFPVFSRLSPRSRLDFAISHLLTHNPNIDLYIYCEAMS